MATYFKIVSIRAVPKFLRKPNNVKYLAELKQKIDLDGYVEEEEDDEEDVLDKKGKGGFS